MLDSDDELGVTHCKSAIGSEAFVESRHWRLS